MDKITYDRQHPKYIEDLCNVANSLPSELISGKVFLITGATGLLGTFIVDALMQYNLHADNPVKILAMGRNLVRAKTRFLPFWDHPSFTFIEQDVCVPIDIKCCDFIIHCASNAHPTAYKEDPVGTIMTNIDGTRNMLDLCVKTGAMLVLLSSVEVYGQSSDNDYVFSEDSQGTLDLSNPRNGYPESKRLAELLCQSYYAQYGIRSKIVRLCRIFGPTMTSSDSKATAQFLRAAKRKQNVVLKSLGNQSYSFCYVSDACSAIFYVLFHGELCVPYNVSTSLCDCKLKHFAETVATVSGVNVAYDIPQMFINDGASNAASGLLNSERLFRLGWRAHYDVEMAIKRTLEIMTE